jgi:hypothetical protein
LQLFTGGGDYSARLDIPEILRKLGRVLDTGRLDRLIVGWAPAADISWLRAALRGSGVKLFLWLPCFSELETLGDFPPLIGADAKPADIRFERGNGERFRFACPAASPEHVIKAYGKHYADAGYDGVFLDRIRYPSFIGGFSSVLGCYCGLCREQHPLPDAGELAARDGANPLGLSAYENMRYSMDDAFMRLFDRKCDAVYGAVSVLAGFFRARGLEIGLDLFAPFLACFVGQDYRRLLGLADFVKPMFYGVTDAPAGIPFELWQYARAFGGGEESAMLRRNALLSLVGGEAGLMGREIADIKRFVSGNRLNAKVCAGIEFNRIDGVADVDENYLQARLNEAADADGIVASWDLNAISAEHIDCLLSYS